MKLKQSKTLVRRCGILIALIVQFLITGCANNNSGNTIAIPVPGTSYNAQSVNISPMALSVYTENTDEKNKIQTSQSEFDAPWKLFDRNTDTLFVSSNKIRIRCELKTRYAIKEIGLFGATSSNISVYDDNNKNITPLLLNNNKNDFKETWNLYALDNSVDTKSITFEITPASDVDSGIREIEIWGVPSNTAEALPLLQSLRNVIGAHDVNSINIEDALNIIECSAVPQEVSSPQSQNRDNAAKLIVDIPGEPGQFKRAYLKYSAMNFEHPVQVERMINGLSWTGGQELPVNSDENAKWHELVEEINTEWLKRGQNEIAFASSQMEISVKDLSIILEYDTGWDYISASSHKEINDGLTNTAGILSADEPVMEIEFEKIVQSHELFIHVAGPQTGEILLSYLSDAQWREIKSDWKIDLKGFIAGWNKIIIPEGVAAQALRLTLCGNGDNQDIRIQEAIVRASPVGYGLIKPKIITSYPKNGEYFGRQAYAQGFVVKSKSGFLPNEFTVNNRLTEPLNPDGSFSVSFTKDETGYILQEDDESWDPDLMMTDYIFQAHAALHLDNNLLSEKNSGSGINDGSTGSGTGENSGDGSESYSTEINPSSSKTISYRSVTVTVPAGAVDQKTLITIIPLREDQIAKLNPGMANVTSPDAGYRFLFNGKPHGKFKKPIRISFTYGKSLLIPGHTDDDVRMFYHDEANKTWKSLYRVNYNRESASAGTGVSTSSTVAPKAAVVSAERALITSETDHFTDIINATLTVPEHPETLSYNPNSIKDIKAGDPGAGINLIEPPRPGNMGDATLSYPIEVPRGRNGMQPSVAIQYNSSGGNGWLGIGWDVPVSAISIDTKYGVPRYTGDEDYILDGAPLVRDQVSSTAACAVYRPRTESSFMRIRRYGNGPSSYWWEVTDTGGTRYIYGQNLNNESRMCENNIFQWNLEKMIDANGNAVTYKYFKDGNQRYLQEINYTAYCGTGNTTCSTGAYTVHFNLSERDDATSTGRPGFLVETRYRLASIEVIFNGALVRSYNLDYNYGPFGKSRLSSIIQRGDDGSEFNRHSFDYHDDERGFAGELEYWDYGCSLGNSISTSFGASLNLGFSPLSFNQKSFSFGGKGGFNIEDKNQFRAFIDINGDNLPDIVNVIGPSVNYQRNLGEGNGFADAKTITFSTPNLSHDSSVSYSIGPTVHAWIISLFADFSWGSTTTNSYFSDVNGDGLVDFVKDGTVLYNKLDPKNNYEPTLDDKLPSYTETAVDYVEGDSANLDSVDLGQVPSNDRQLKQYYREDPIRVWEAPYMGLVKVTGDMQLLDYKPAGENYTTRDGVEVSIHKNKKLLWSADIKADNFGSNGKTPFGIDDIWVEQGDRIYFRVNSIIDGAYDIVEWNPTIEYLGVAADQVDENNLPVYRYSASNDFSIATDMDNYFSVPYGGPEGTGDKPKISGQFIKESETSDDITIEIIRLDAETGNEIPLYTKTILRDNTSYDKDSPLLIDIDVDDLYIFYYQDPDGKWILKPDKILCRLSSDTPIDWSGVSLKPVLSYSMIEIYTVTEAGVVTTAQPCGDCTYKLPVTTRFFPEHDRIPIEPYVVTKGGNVTVHYNAQKRLPMIDNYESKVTLAVKRYSSGGQLLDVDKESAVITGDQNPQSIELKEDYYVSPGQKLYFVCASDRHDIEEQVLIGLPMITYQDDTTYDASGAVYTAREEQHLLSGGYRSWYYGRWNGEKEFDPSLMTTNESLKSLADNPPTYDDPNIDLIREKISLIPAMAPLSEPASNRTENDLPKPPTFDFSAETKGIWHGNDKDCWILPDKMSSTRVIKKYIPEAEETEPGSGVSNVTLDSLSIARGRGVSKYTNSSFIGAGGNVGFVGIAFTNGTMDTLIDFFDMNGDRYPDIVTSGRVQYTSKNGSLGNSKSVDFGSIRPVRHNSSLNIDASVTYNSEAKPVETEVRGNGEVKGHKNSSISRGKTVTESDFIDVNGDGLPDRVYIIGNPYLGPVETKVRYNLGYSFSGEHSYDDTSFRVNKTATVSGGGGIGYYSDKNAYGGGVSGNLTMSGLEVDYIDINGDGLPDRVSRLLDEYDPRNISGNIKVQYNNGGTFGVEQYLPGSIPAAPLSLNITVMGSPSAYFTVSIPIWVIIQIGSIQINPGINAGVEVDDTTFNLEDINGDGLPDHVSQVGGVIWANMNKNGKTDLLKEVRRPMGGVIEIDYDSVGNTQDMPDRRWVMSRIKVTDGMGDTEGHVYTTQYEYQNGKYLRGEREFVGFESVTESRDDDSSAERHYMNENIYQKGIEWISIIRGRDSDGVYSINRKNYILKDNTINNNPIKNSRISQLVKDETFHLDGYSGDIDINNLPSDSFDIAVSHEFEYDSYGNVTHFTTSGTNIDPVDAMIQYAYNQPRYIMNRPRAIVVTGNGDLYRRRTGLYDSKGNLCELRAYQNSGAAAVTRIGYDQLGNVINVTGPANAKVQRYSLIYTYDDAVRTYVTGIRDSFGYTSSYSYDYRYGVPLITMDTNRQRMLYNYDHFGRLISVYGPYDTGSPIPTITVTYNPEGSYPVWALVRNKARPEALDTVDTAVFKDGLQRVIQTKKSAEVNGATSVIVSGKIVYDVMGRVKFEGQPAPSSDSITFYSDIGMTNSTEYFYDAIGRNTEILYPDGSQIKMEYGFDNGYFTVHTWDQKDKEKRVYKNARELITRMEELNNGEWIKTEYAYNPMNEITQITDDRNNKTAITYDYLGNRTSIDNPDTGLVEYIYDTAGNLTRKFTPNLSDRGRHINYYYTFNRLERVDYPFGDDIYYTYGGPGAGYNRAGRIQSIRCGDIREERYYGRLGELTRSVRSINTATFGIRFQSYVTGYKYDNLGRLERLVYPDGEVLTYAYDEGGLPDNAMGMKNEQRLNYIVNIDYDEFGQRTMIAYGNGVTTVYEYDDDMRRLIKLRSTRGEAVLQNIEYGYDNVGNIISRNNRDFKTGEGSDNSAHQSYGYDDLHRLVNSTGTFTNSAGVNEYTNEINYDSIGNILLKIQTNTFTPEGGSGGSGVDIPETNYTYNYVYGSPKPQKPHAVTSTGSTTYKYDANGNMTAATGLDFNRIITWDEENNMTGTKDNEGSTVYKYDYSGDRFLKSGGLGETVYVNTNYSVRNRSVISKHVFAGNIRVASIVFSGDGDPAVYYYHGDHLGSSSVVTAQDGSFYEALEYFPYGETWVQKQATTGTMPYKFTGKELDPETGLYYFGARYFDPKLSRWISADPILAKYLPTVNQDNEQNLPGMGGVFNPINLDLYCFTHQNPIKYIDPDGRWSKESHKYVFIKILLKYGIKPEIAKALGEANAGIDAVVKGSTTYARVNPDLHRSKLSQKHDTISGEEKYANTPDAQLIQDDNTYMGNLEASAATSLNNILNNNSNSLAQSDVDNIAKFFHATMDRQTHIGEHNDETDSIYDKNGNSRIQASNMIDDLTNKLNAMTKKNISLNDKQKAEIFKKCNEKFKNNE